MKTHRAWILALTSVIAIAVSQTAMGQTMGGPMMGNPMMGRAPMPAANPGFATFSQGQPVVQQASFSACGACDGAGCGICGVTPTAGGFRMSNIGHGSGCGCDSGGCGASPVGGALKGFGGMGMGGIGAACGSCGTACGGSCGGLGIGGGGGLGSGLGSVAVSPAGHVMSSLQGMAASRNGGFGTMMHGQENGPFGGAGCCTPIWYDLDIGWMSLKRDGGSGIALTSRGIDGPIIMTADDDGDVAHGFRAAYSFLIGPSTALELGYFGTHEWEGSGSVTGDGDLYSAFGNFGLKQRTVVVDPNTVPPTTDTIFGFPQTLDAADSHSFTFSSELHNAELNLRRRWVAAGCLLHGSYLGGVRYVSLQESMTFDTSVTDGGFLDYDVNTNNDLVGVQLGGDMYVCVSPRFKVGIELEGGIYGNDASVDSRINTREVNQGINQIPTVDATPVNESTSDTDVAFVGELGATALFRVTPRLMIKGGYTMLYLDNVAMAMENFSTSTEPSLATRPVAFDNRSEVLFHGANLGITWMW